MSRFKIFIVTIHIAGWLLFMAFPLLFLNGGGWASDISILKSSWYWLFEGTYIILFYLNAYILIPRLFFKKKYVGYTLIAFVLLGCVYFIKPYDKLLRNNENYINNPFHQGWRSFGRWQQNGGNNMHPGDTSFHNMHTPPYDGQQGPPPGIQWDDSVHRNHWHHPSDHPQWPPHHFRIDSTSLFIFLMIMAISTAIKVVQQWQLTEQRATQAEADKASAELSFLKAQINPHFLFNTLNNIYTLAVTKDENAPDSIMKLSNIMRYVTDDVMLDFVPLQSEVDCISDYIELQRLRMSANTPIDFTVKGDLENKRIPPLLLMTFIENVFKYGISKHEPSVIAINIDVTDVNISFFCQNRIFVKNNDTQRKGIGIKNTKQRLEYLYPNKHLLYITNDNQLYTVQLVLQT